MSLKGFWGESIGHVCSSFLGFFSKNEEEAIPPGGKKYLGTIKASTRMILVHVQKMYKTCTEDVQYI